MLAKTTIGVNIAGSNVAPSPKLRVVDEGRKQLRWRIYQTRILHSQATEDPDMGAASVPCTSGNGDVGSAIIVDVAATKTPPVIMASYG